MDEVMDRVKDRVVETQLKIYNTICYRSFVFLVTGNIVYKCEFVCRDGTYEILNAGRTTNNR